MSEKANSEQYDGLLTTLAQNVQGIEPLLDAFFGFLQRRTDFFSGQDNSRKTDEIVLKYLHKYGKLANARLEEDRIRNKRIDEEKRQMSMKKEAEEEEEFRKKQAVLKKHPKIEEVFDQPAAAPSDTSVIHDETKEDDADDDTSGSPAPIGNGGTTDKYTWTQTLSALEILLPMPPGTRAKDCKVIIGAKTLKVGVIGKPLIIDGQLHQKIKPDDSMWIFVDSNIQLNLEKFDGMRWWSCAIIGDPEIDTKKIVPENSKLADLDPETRGTVEKMMVDQRQRQMGLPTSDQQKQAELLDKFKKAHPELDFSSARINYGGEQGFNFGGN